MRIASAQITNFRCLQKVDLSFDHVTTFIGPNGGGKSSILRALDWFFNGDRADLTEADVYAGAHPSDQRIRVQVIFDHLTDRDREALGPKYAPSTVDTFTAWRTWDAGNDKITGKALAFKPFEAVRGAQGASAKRQALASAALAYPDLDLPRWQSIEATAAAMDAWERSHPEHLEEAEVSDTHFFGFYGQGKLSGLFDYVFVTADLRASEENTDSRTSIIGRILERAVDREAANLAFRELASEIADKQRQINDEHLSGQLADLAAALSEEVSAFTTGRTVALLATVPELKQIASRVDVRIRDNLVETTVDRQGHGFQRALLLASLKLLATRSSRTSDKGVICLAIEEPELFQHPTQARVFDTVLRALAQGDSNDLQVAYATHSPYFVDPRFFYQIRRVSRRTTGPREYVDVDVFHATQDAVRKRLSGYVSGPEINSRFHQVCLKGLSEALFADAVVLVEGEVDKAVLEGIAARSASFAHDGIAVASANGKAHLLLPWAILKALGIPTLVVFDNDENLERRMADQGKTAQDQAAAAAEARAANRRLLRAFGLPEADYPRGILSRTVVAVPDTLESLISAAWPEWLTTKERLISEGQGVHGKNAATYALACEECSVGPTGLLISIVEAVRSITGSRRSV